MGTTDDYRGEWEDFDVYIDADILCLIYHLPMEVFVHLSAAGLVRSWIHEDGPLMLQSLEVVAVIGNPGYTYRN